MTWDDACKAAKKSGQLMRCAFWIEDGALKLFRETQEFPLDAFETSLDMLEEALSQEESRLETLAP